MELNLKVFTCLCSCEEFSINGVKADSDDFGDQNDEDPEEEEYSGCGNMRFRAKLPTQEILDKYKINVDEYKKIAEELEDKLSFGNCGWCA